MASISKRVSGEWQNTSYGIRATVTDTITTLPATIYGDGTNATIAIKGNTIQSGTPTPESPVMPEGCGERTGNYLPTPVTATVESAGITIESTGDGTINVSGTRTSGASPIINLKEAVTLNGTYYVHLRNNVAAPSSTIVLRNGTTSIANITLTSTNIITQITLSNVTIDNIQVYVTSGTSINAQMAISIEQTDSVTEYEPWGVKIPILSAGQTTPVYLGEVQSTRKIKKLLLTGQEDWKLQSINSYGIANFYIPVSDRDSSSPNTYYCSHFKVKESGISAETEESMRFNTNNQLFLRILSTTASTVSGIQQWLAAQYAAGTPVTVWYVLATEETTVVNEPLMKIDGYADEVNGISIPTTDGANTLSVDTTVQPSEVSINYHGWHMGTVHERVSGAWD